MNYLEEVSPAFMGLLECIRQKNKVRTSGIIKESIPIFVATLLDKSNKDLLLIVNTEKRARDLEKDLLSLGVNTILWESRERIFYSIDVSSKEKIQHRLRSLYRAMNEKDGKIILTTPKALTFPLMRRERFISLIFSLSVGDIKSISELKDKLNYLGYEARERVESVGQFAVRGGIMDIYSIDHPYRIEFFDDEVDSIRIFDPYTQVSTENVESLTIYPQDEWLFDEIEKEEIANKIELMLNNSLKKLKGDELAKETAKEKFETLIASLRENLSLDNIDLLLPFIDKAQFDSLYSYISKDTITFYEDIPRTLEDEEGREERIREDLKELIFEGEWLSEMNYPLISLTDLLMREEVEIYNSEFLQSVEEINFQEILNWNMRNIPHYGRRWNLFFEELRDYTKNSYEVFIFLGDNERRETIERTLANEEIEGDIKIIDNSLSQGFVLPDIKKVIFTEGELFESNRRVERKSEKKKSEYLSFKDLKEGEYVVHENYGIGIYEGVNTMEVDGIKKDFLTIQYHGSERLYIPIEQLKWLQKYIGTGDSNPKITKLSSDEWRKKKSKAKRAVEEMAEDLILLYAKRANRKGYAFSEDTPWQRDFELSFPYQDTQGQSRSTEEIKKDMESPKAMDRLLLGDVGYGKTEVALRAAFKAVSDNKQVAFLVPTTILAEQHFGVIRERFRKFPITSEVLSRFTSKKVQSDIIKRLKQGVVDILVGTHRILSEDVKFKDLGLLIVDEEQRFGVRQKEELKKLKENVDVLTLSATPIPRTLHLSLSGIRDISVLDEPPEDRFPIQTYVAEYHPELVRQAIIKEIDRGGQVYYLYNRTETISQETSMLMELVPEARFRYAHGRMSANELESVMRDFLNREFDVLVCTTIIETGLDIPNVNTIIITDADKLGLSQLYQLRGRVGRSNRVAYGYMTYKRNKVLSDVASKRLRAIKEFTKFGSGYQIALRDLQIRGAGNLLGVSQHGHMSEIGYDLYVKFLNLAIKRHSLEEEEIEPRESSIDLKYSAFIPEHYIEDDVFRLEIYKKISAIESEEDKEDLIDELIDRFGEPDEEVINLMDISLIRFSAEKMGVKNLRERDDLIILDFYEAINLSIYNSLVSIYGNRLEYIPKKRSLSYRIKMGDLKEIKDFINDYIRYLN